MTESTFPAIGMADFDMERWILSTLEEDAATDENVEAIAQVECMGDEITAVERYLDGGWRDDAPEDRVHLGTAQERAEEEVRLLMGRWALLTGRTATLVKPTREAHRFTLTIA
jgi:hypothetical protein